MILKKKSHLLSAVIGVVTHTALENVSIRWLSIFLAFDLLAIEFDVNVTDDLYGQVASLIRFSCGENPS